MSNADFQTWRAEIEAELVEATDVLNAAKSALEAAQTARDLANTEERRVSILLDSLSNQSDDASRLWGTGRRGISPYLTARRDPATRAVHAAEGALTMAKEHLKNAQHRVDDIRDALNVITSAMIPAEEVS